MWRRLPASFLGSRDRSELATAEENVGSSPTFSRWALETPSSPRRTCSPCGKNLSQSHSRGGRERTLEQAASGWTPYHNRRISTEDGHNVRISATALVHNHHYSYIAVFTLLPDIWYNRQKYYSIYSKKIYLLLVYWVLLIYSSQVLENNYNGMKHKIIILKYTCT